MNFQLKERKNIISSLIKQDNFKVISFDIFDARCLCACLVSRSIQMKTVSVIIPCFLDSATLARAIDSVLAQDYPAIEIIAKTIKDICCWIVSSVVSKF